MHSDHTKIQDQRNAVKLKNQQISDIKVVGERCNNSSNFEDSNTDITTISSFTHDSQRERNVSLKEQLHQKLNSKLEDVLLGIKIYDKQLTGKILPVNLYNVLRIFCFPLSLKEFDSLISEDAVHENGLIAYKLFLSNYISNENEVSSLLLPKENRPVSSLNTEDLEIKIKNKISKNIKNFIRCMWLHDFNNDGLIQKEDLKTVLETLCFPLSDDDFNRFWSLYDPTNSGLVNYKDFLLKLGTHTESYKRILPSQKSAIPSSLSCSSKYSRDEQIQLLCAKLGRDDPAVQGQFLSRILDVFKEKVKQEFPILMRAFQIKDSSRSGFVHISVFHQVLNYFVMPTSLQLFKEILRSFNISPNNSKIAWYSFLKKISMNGEVKCEPNNTPLKGSISWKICKSVLEKLKRNGKNEDNFFKHAFTMPMQNHKLAVTRAELRKVINQSLVLPVSEEEFRSLMFILDPGHTNFIDCETFLCLFKIVTEDKGDQISKLSSEELVESKNTNSNLSGQKLKTAFKKCFNKNFKNIEKAFYAFDSEETGAISVDDFRKVLDVFCFPLTDRQFCEIIKDFTLSNKIFYGDFINFNKKSPYEDEEKWKTCVKKMVSPKTIPKQKLNFEEMIKYVQEMVSCNKDNFLKEFQNYDLCNTGGVRKEVLSKLIQKHVFRLTNEQFDHLWEKLPKNEIGFLMYQEFLDEWCAPSVLQYDAKTPSSTRSNSAMSAYSKNSSKGSCILNARERPRTASSVMSVKSASTISKASRPKSAISHHSLTNLSSKSNSHLSVNGKGFPNCSVLTKEQYKQYKSLDFGKTEGLRKFVSQTKNHRSTSDGTSEIKEQEKVNNQNIYEDIIKTRWRDILRRCKKLDPENHDIILWDDFISILQRTGIDINEKSLKFLENKYNVKRDLPINYWIFLKKFLIHLNSEQTQIKDWGSKQAAAGQESVGLCKVLLNYRDKIMKHYRDLHHAFRRADIYRTGNIKTLEFRKILIFHKIYMTDQDFFYIQDYFDPQLAERIPYDKFLKSFVRN